MRQFNIKEGRKEGRCDGSQDKVKQCKAEYSKVKQGMTG